MVVRILSAGSEAMGLWNPREGRIWRGAGPWSIDPGPASGFNLELRALPDRGDWLRLEMPRFTEPRPVEIVILPRIPLGESVYAETFDLLVEGVRAFDAGRVRRWAPELLRVARPAAVPEVDYLGTLEEAVQLWNLYLGRPRLRLVDEGEDAEVVCELSEEARLGYVRRLEEDASGRPMRMLIHLSPRWTVGAERYVRRAWSHELGHVLGMWGHSEDPRHLMYGRFIAVDEPLPEEARVIDWIWELPHGTQLAWYRRGAPASGVPLAHPPAEGIAGANLASFTPPRGARAGETVDCRPARR